MTEIKKAKTLQLRPSMEALGIALSFVCRSSPYAEFRAAKIIKAIQHQLSSGSHVCLIENEQLVAYAGWLPIDLADGENWLAGKGTLHPSSSANPQAVALTIVSTTDPSQIPQLIRACRRLAPQRTVYFKRDYPGGRSKKSKVQNRTRRAP
jgi:hemolysin-activating ACP:hemolysin acyltransferase